MQTLRRSYQITRLVLVWFALSLGVAIASPLANPQGMELVCTSANGMQLVVMGDERSDDKGGHTLDCPLCATLNVLNPTFNTALTQPSPQVMPRPTVVVVFVMVATATPPPSRAPPQLLAEKNQA
jgi:hypothetical protein